MFGCELSHLKELIKWKVGTKGFIVKSFYKFLKAKSIKFPYRFLWKVKITNKIKFFLCLDEAFKQKMF